MKERTARCCCGDVSITLRGEPERVFRCHCHYCQRRTGNVFQTSAWFFEDQIIARTGETRVFNESENNQGVDYTFCVRCGSTVYWPFTGSLPGLYEVAVGCFEDPDFPAPTYEIWEQYRHPWVPELVSGESYKDFPPTGAAISTCCTGPRTRSSTVTPICWPPPIKAPAFARRRFTTGRSASA